MPSRFHWDLPGLNKDRFQAYTSLLRLRNGGQVHERLEAECELEDKHGPIGHDDTDSVVAQPISPFDDRKIREAFQDRVAELVSNDKGGYHVAATLMINSPGGVRLVVAKNEGFDQMDREFLENLQNSLREIARTPGPCEDGQRSALWDNMIVHSDARLREWVAEFQEVAKTFAKCCLGAPTDAAKSQTLHSDILELLDRSFNETTSSLVVKAHAIWNLYGEGDFITLCDESPQLAKRLRLSIGFLGRLRIGFNTMVRAAERLNNLQGLTICPLLTLPGKKPKKTRSKGRRTGWSLCRSFQSLSQPLNDSTVKLLLGQNWTQKRLLAEYEKVQRQSPQIHAEVQLLLYAAQQNLEEGVHSGYIGCSKRSCFLCWEFLEAHRVFRTRASHGKIYNIWTVPDTEDLPEERLAAVVSAVKSVEEVVKNILRTPRQDTPQQAKESTIGDSSIATRLPLHPSRYTASLMSQHIMHERQAENVRLVRELISGRNPPTDDPYEQELSEAENSIPNINRDSVVEHGGNCCGCDRWTKRRCPYCDKDWYCSPICSAKPILHRFECAGAALTTADYLERAVLDDRIPDDPQTMEDYGFSRCETWNQKSHLLGLYTGLFSYLNVPSQDLDDWRRNGKLVGNIVKKYTELPEGKRGGYFPWFLQHKDILEDGTSSEPRQPVQLIAEIMQGAMPFLQPNDRIKPFEELQPIEKQDSVLFFAMTREHMHPIPRGPGDLWYRFGYCVCVDEHEEGQLGHLYGKLLSGDKFLVSYSQSLGTEHSRPNHVPTATFEEFWRAFAAGKLIQLMDRYGLREARLGFRQLESFLATRPAETHPVVWRLCHFLAFEVTAVDIPMEAWAAAQHYGFSSELSARMKIELRAFYKGLLSEGDPLELDHARSHG